MNDVEKQKLIDISWQLHAQVETAYAQSKAVEGDSNWLEKQRYLLADMALHLLQTAMKPEEIELDKLRNNLHAILTIADRFLPGAELKKATEKLYES